MLLSGHLRYCGKNSSSVPSSSTDLCVYYFSLNPKPRQRHRQLEAAWAGAAWIEEDYSVTIGEDSAYAVAADDGMRILSPQDRLPDHSRCG